MDAFILAVLQGITEFLPVSSSGHLVILDELLPIQSGMLFDLMLHLATLVSVCAFYRREIAEIFVGCIRELRGAPETQDKKNLKFVGFLLISTFITGIIGLCLNDAVENHLRSLVIVGSLLVVNAVILWFSQKRGLFRVTDGALNLKSSIVIGLAQGIAVLPGISRSGSTITAALLLGIENKDCAKISFLLSIPVILGAGVLHIGELDNLDDIVGGSVAIVMAAAVVAAVVGYISLVLLNRILQNARFHHFAPYCLIVGLLALGFGIFG